MTLRELQNLNRVSDQHVASSIKYYYSDIPIGEPCLREARPETSKPLGACAKSSVQHRPGRGALNRNITLSSNFHLSYADSLGRERLSMQCDTAIALVGADRLRQVSLIHQGIYGFGLF